MESEKDTLQPFPSYTPKQEGWEDWYNEILPQAYQCAGYALQQWEKTRSPFKWIRETSLLKPTFQHLSFGYNNNIFSVLVEVVEKGKASYLRQTDLRNLLSMSRENNLVPCIIPIDFDSPHDPLVGGCHLINAETRLPLYIDAFPTIDKIEMSPWEVQHMGMSIVKYLLEKEGKKVVRFVDMPDAIPQLWFEYDNKSSYVVVETIAHGDHAKMGYFGDCWMGLEEDGYYAKIELIPIDKNDGRKLWRGHGFHANFEGLVNIKDLPHKRNTSYHVHRFSD